MAEEAIQQWQKERARVVAYLRAKADHELRDGAHRMVVETLKQAADEIERGDHSAVDLGPLKLSTKGSTTLK